MFRKKRSFIISIALAFLWGSFCLPLQAGITTSHLPERLGLPWPCGESYRVTSSPQDHWAQGKATGIAYDFSMYEGTPLFAPASGHACFMTDERELETNFGNYIEIIVDGDWMIRMAHLRDRQSGERHVEAGEFLGYSGRSGVSLAHLHLELLERQGDAWACPDTSTWQAFFGIRFDELAEDAYITNEGCPPAPRLALQDNLCPDKAELGALLPLTPSIWNDGFLPLQVDRLDVVMSGPEEQIVIASDSRPVLIPGKQATTFSAWVLPQMSGEWRVVRLNIFSQGDVYTLPTKDQCLITSTSLALQDAEIIRTELGEPLALKARIENRAADDLFQQIFIVRGTQPDGSPWRATSLPMDIPTGTTASVTLESIDTPWSVGTWQVDQIGVQTAWGDLYFAQPDLHLEINGPWVVVARAEIYASAQGLSIYLILQNQGDQATKLDALEVWALSENESAPKLLVLRGIDPLSPGEQQLVHLFTEWASQESGWQIAQASYWAKGRLVPIPLPKADETQHALPTRQ